MEMKMNKPLIQLPTLANVRRRALATTAAAIGATTLTTLTGCGLSGGQHKSEPVASEATTITPESTASQIKAFTAGLDEAIAKLDKDKIKQAKEAAQNNQTVTPVNTSQLPTRRTKLTQAAPSAPTDDDPIPTALILDRLEIPLPGLAPQSSRASFYATPNQSLPNLETAPTDEDTPLTFDDLTAPPPAPAAPPLDMALDTLRASVAARPTLATALALNLLDNAEGKSADPSLVKELSLNDQKLLQDLTAALQSISNSNTPAAVLADRAAPLIDATKKWQPTASADKDLNLPILALASRVDSFGVYNKLDPKFTAGEKHTVILYCEVANFVPKKTSDGWYETHLSQQETIATEDGLLLWRPNPEDVEDRSKNLRKDFYLVKKLTIPDNLAVGKYALRMSVTDKNTNKIAVVTLPIEIVR
jgi:hypothetical protein